MEEREGLNVAMRIGKEASFLVEPHGDRYETPLASTELMHYQNPVNVFY
jgi:hypothetical protein